ncbi:MAG: hypothetical protein KDB98_10125 [Flavobacteriales bacterium]|nr:hypothetical protein [Flavobacteriales bacterium]
MILGLAFVSPYAFADIGLTHQLKEQRKELLRELKTLTADSLKLSAQQSFRANEIRDEIISIDSQIISSYDETVGRLAARNRDHSANERAIVYLALGALGLAFLFFVIVAIARKRIISAGNDGLLDVFKQLGSELVHSVSHENVKAKSLLRVNVVVVLGLILMSISVLAFLLRTL